MDNTFVTADYELPLPYRKPSAGQSPCSESTLGTEQPQWSAACTKKQRSFRIALQLQLYITLLLQWCRAKLFSGDIKQEKCSWVDQKGRCAGNFEISLGNIGWLGACLISASISPQHPLINSMLKLSTVL